MYIYIYILTYIFSLQYRFNYRRIVIGLQHFRSLSTSAFRRPIVTHNLIISDRSPLPLPKFQTAPRIRLLISSWYKKYSPDMHVSMKSTFVT